MAVRSRRRIYHENDPYAKGNDIQGDKIAAILGRWIDHDIQFALLSIMIVTHWANAKRERWKRPDGTVETRNFDRIPLKQVLALTCQNIYKIRRPYRVMLDAKKLGVPGIEWEFKRRPSQYQLRKMAQWSLKVWGPDWRRHSEVKMLAQLPWRRTLSGAKRVGFVTTIINFDGNPADLPSYVDKYRRPH